MVREAIYRRTRALLGATFGVIAVFLIAITTFGYFRGRESRGDIDVLHDDAIVSVRLVDRLALDIEQIQLLISQHIFDKDLSVALAMERQMADVWRDYDDAAAIYTPLTTFPGEADAWRRLTVDVAAMRANLVPVIQLSRVNLDQEAMAMMTGLEPLFAAIRGHIDELVSINLTASDRLVERLSALYDRDLRMRVALVIVVLLVTYLAGAWATRTIMRSQRELVHTAAELETRNRELDAFAGRVAHDLRGPLNTLNLATSVIADTAPETGKTIAMMERGIQQMANLVDDLLQLSRIGTATGETSQIEPVAAALTTDLTPLVKDAGGKLAVRLEPAHVSCSPSLVRQLLWNLGENAVKYRRTDAPLALELEGHAHLDRYEIRVSDNGIGMSSEDVAHIFEPFFRAAPTRAVPGTGLGLSIVRRIVEASGGTVVVESVVGHGTTFAVTLPLARAS